MLFTAKFYFRLFTPERLDIHRQNFKLYRMASQFTRFNLNIFERFRITHSHNN